jgi:hypothetical protein
MVVRRIEQHQRVARGDLQAARPARGGQTASDRIGLHAGIT